MVRIAISRHGQEGVEQVSWPAEELQIIEKPNGPAAAAVLAVGVGVLVLGVLAVLSEASTSIHDWLEFSERVGPLSGKTTIAAVAWLGSWLASAALLWRRQVAFSAVIVISGGFFALGVIGTFPEVFERFK